MADKKVDFKEFLEFVMKKPITLMDLESSSIENFMWQAKTIILKVSLRCIISMVYEHAARDLTPFVLLIGTWY